MARSTRYPELSIAQVDVTQASFIARTFEALQTETRRQKQPVRIAPTRRRPRR
jgi:hypothetical protein